MAKKKQPYIPLYTGDYIKDTRSLSLSAKGAWSDIILFMWSQETDGIMEGSLADFARLIGGTLEETACVLLELCSKKICDGGPNDKGFYRIVCRRLVKEAAISAIRSEIGSKGGSKTQANSKAKLKQTPDNDNEIDTDNEIQIKLKESLDEIYIDGQRMKWTHIDFDRELMGFKEKVIGSPGKYIDHDVGAIRLAFQSQLRSARSKPIIPKQPVKKLTIDDLK